MRSKLATHQAFRVCLAARVRKTLSRRHALLRVRLCGELSALRARAPAQPGHFARCRLLARPSQDPPQDRNPRPHIPEPQARPSQDRPRTATPARTRPRTTGAPVPQPPPDPPPTPNPPPPHPPPPPPPGPTTPAPQPPPPADTWPPAPAAPQPGRQ